METVGLRVAEVRDLIFILAAENHPDNAPFVSTWTQQQHEQALIDRDLLTQVIEGPNHEPVGYVMVAGLESPHRSVELRRLVITEKGKGYGRQVLRLVKRFIFEEQRAHRLWLDVKDHNLRAKHLYESEGFVVEGTLRECLKNGEMFESMVILSMLSVEYFATKRG